MTRRRSRCAWLAGWLACLLAASASASADDERRGWGDPCRPADADRSAAIHELYQQRDRAPVWLTREGRTPAGRRFVPILRTAADGVVTECLEQALAGRDSRYSRGALDVLLTDAYLVLSQRRSGDADDPNAHLAALAPGQQDRLQRRLDELARLDAGPAEPGLVSAASAVERMRAALQRYRRIADRGGWPRVGAGPTLEPGDRDPRVPALRERLAATGDLPADVRDRRGERYGGGLVEAVVRFQARHGLQTDGLVGPATRQTLDVPARQRVAQLQVNLRRIEAHAIDGPGPFVRVNIPDFRVSLYEAGRVTFSTRAIVGQPGRQTPQLQTRITALTLNPDWNVPRVIVREDLADRFARDEGYAERHGFQAVNSEQPLAALDWSEKPMVAVRQAPGPTNALGRIKFEMPNRRAIYLHDTPARHLFQSRERAFSAGCVRVEEPMQLAAHLSGIDRERLEHMARSGHTRTLRLGWRVPVQLVYFTAWVDTRGRVQFRPDIYDRDGVQGL